MRVSLSLVLLAAATSLLAAEDNVVGKNPIEAAKREFEQGHLDRALALVNEADKAGPPDAQSVILRICIFTEQGKFEDAASLFDAVPAAELTIPGRIRMGDVFLRQHKWEEARESYAATLKETNVLMLNERLRYAIFMTYLGEKNEVEAQRAYEGIAFPTESAAYYYTQAAWDYAHGNNHDAESWLKRAREIFPVRSTAWFAQPLFDFGWVKSKPPLILE